MIRVHVQQKQNSIPKYGSRYLCAYVCGACECVEARGWFLVPSIIGLFFFRDRTSVNPELAKWLEQPTGELEGITQERYEW